MSEYAFWAMNNKLLDVLVLMSPSVFLGIIVLLISASKFKYKNELMLLGAILMSGVSIFTMTNNSLMKMAYQKTGVHFTMREDNKFYINYKTTEKSPVGYDLRGNAVDFNTVQVTHYRVIHCKLDSKVIDYRQCWDMIKDKSKEELAIMSLQIRQNEYITMNK